MTSSALAAFWTVLSRVGQSIVDRNAASVLKAICLAMSLPLPINSSFKTLVCPVTDRTVLTVMARLTSKILLITNLL